LTDAPWVAGPEWAGDRCFIVGSGPSVAQQNLEVLRGRRVIAVNSSWPLVPFADFLLFGDGRWWRQYRNDALAGFPGRIVTCDWGSVHSRVLRMRRVKPPGLASRNDTLAMRRTSLSAAINLAVHLGVKSIVLIGIDNKVATDGRTHFHDRHPWDQITRCWQEQRDDLETLVVPLRDRSIETVNASPGSALPCWPIVTLEDYL
jgi:hypothetical protein